MSYWRSRSVSDPPHHGIIRVRRPTIPGSLVGAEIASPPSGLLTRPPARGNIVVAVAVQVNSPDPIVVDGR